RIRCVPGVLRGLDLGPGAGEVERGQWGTLLGSHDGRLQLMSGIWPAVSYENWRDTCDTLHAHTQVLGKLAAKLAPAEPQLQHAALRLTARGWETAPLPAPDRAGSLSIRPDLHRHEAVAEHSDGRVGRGPLPP